MKRGFTLVELLVVVTIIVVLLALLVPALDKAIYQAELAKCGAQQKTIATGLLVYAAQSKRYYPPRPSFVALQRTEAAYLGRQDTGDDRKLLVPLMSLKALLCPLAGGNVIDLGYEANEPVTFVHPSYDLWFGWGYPRLKATRRIGDRFEWATDSFSVLVSDRDALRGDNHSAHPDDAGIMALASHQNFDPFAGGALGKVTVSWWGGGSRGLIDRNLTYQDGSVERFTRLQWDDDRMTLVPNWRNNANPEAQQQLPTK